MAQQQPQGPSDPEATGGGMSDAPENWGNGGLVGDGRYRLTRRLGRGGMAEVFAAEDVRLGRTVAVKLLRADLAEDPTSKARFTREAQSVAGLNHHAIVAVYDSGEDFVGGQSVPYIVMEIVEGRTIRDLLLNAEAPGPEQALIIVSGVLEALAYSHQHGIVHRDIKPANVIITHNGAVKVMDFGIARALHGASTTMTQTGMVMGTPQYLSPEQALGKAVDYRSDLYATGCLLYELLALRPPFIGETPLSVVYQHVQDIPMPPSQSSEGQCPPELDGLVMRSLAKEPDDRFQTAEEMRGLVQYALQMLYDQGGHTGTWNTGPVAMHDGRAAAGPYSSTTMMPQHDGSMTSQIPQPILPTGYGNGDDGGFEGHGNRGSGRGKLWILAVLAVIAIAAGVALALNNKTTGSGDTDPTESPSVTQSQTTESSESPSDEASEESSDDTSDDSTGSNSGSYNTPQYTPSDTPQYTPSETASSEPTDTETDPGTSEEPTGSETDGTADGGTGDGGTGDGGTDAGSTQGTTQGNGAVSGLTG